MRTSPSRQPADVGGVSLLPNDLLVRTGPVDHAIWNYSGLLGAIQRRRFRLVMRLLGNAKFERLLEVGYGSGVFAPELANHCDQYCGIDVHECADAVSASLAQVGIRAELRCGSVTAIPFDDRSFACAICVSVFEFVDEVDAACMEIRRVLSDDGLLFVVTPGHSPLLDLGLKVLTGESAKRDFGDRRERIIPALKRQFDIVRIADFPTPSVLGLYMYRALALRKKRG